jgi:hypothetical protein
VEQHGSYSRDDVLRLGFEAICTSGDGTTYLWHGSCGMRVDQKGHTVLLLDGKELPESPWRPTAWGEAEIGNRAESPDSTLACESMAGL